MDIESASSVTYSDERSVFIKYMKQIIVLQYYL